MGQLAEAEDAIAQANILDNKNCLVWALSAILCLQYGDRRLQQACMCSSEAIRLGLDDVHLLEELGDLFHGQ